MIANDHFACQGEFQGTPIPIKFNVKKLVYIKSIEIQPKWGAKKSLFPKHFQL